ncbi:YbhB/YbcL family Raf kinase inhibitor-like protein [Variovorax saccharolyticus]|uniref:YbhB/YbcL family Raf kinase inhibitor-like protein n=1 Tax=Variovorax saccharolyticus TaxID=3053516 RepID=UPI0025753EDC|nr:MULTISPECIES: YbhB/YbcL family Raf kinase inhibitor-like protein [unclassified Variovorax]MDM0019623.1 YbhB/YbcL family Raf kinase inhibitor-like protein [Variovorax sp. J22R187]MDM0027763.1 YbhB/YbcL family Raf kinase inhibitor-like protein [Variovorax sp. J31P216]
MLEKLPDAIGHALHGVRAGLDEITFNTIGLRAGMGAITVTSLAFADHAPLPERYTADGAGRSPPIDWIGVPEGAAALVLVVEDADSPTPHPLVHAIVVDLPPADGGLHESALPSADHEGSGIHAGLNSYLQAAWMPPDPPPGHGIHRYAFQVFALATAPNFSTNPGREELFEALSAHAIASGLLIGTCERHDGSIKLPDLAPAGPLVAG